MSEPNRTQLEQEAKEMFVNYFWNSISTDLKFEILEAKYGDIVHEEYETWLQNNED